MKVVSINLGNIGSTGTIAKSIARAAQKEGITVFQAYPRSASNVPENDTDILIGNERLRWFSIAAAVVTGFNGCFTPAATFRFLRRLDRISPDIIHLHNLHNTYINIPMLFHYIKKRNIRVVWTLHDCWAFTGQCPYFTMAKCKKWKTGCYDCPQYRKYPSSYVDQTKIMWKLKKKWFNGVSDMVIVTPSEWLKNLVKQSFLKDYPVKVIHNGIDPAVFKPTPSDFRKKYGIGGGDFVILGAAYGWSDRKGFDIFIELAERLDKKYRICLVGTDDAADRVIPDNVISIHVTSDQHELAGIYSAADVFVNPTREEVFGMVNVEALACGTPVITFDTGGSVECVDKESGAVVKKMAAGML